MNKAEVTTKWVKLLCTLCGKEYDAGFIQLLNTEIDTSRGKCPDCRERLNKECQAQEEALRLASRATKRREWRESCGVSPLFMTKTFEGFDTKRPGNLAKAHKTCVDYANKFPIEYWRFIKGNPAYHSLVLYSPSMWGVGKTHLVSAIAHRILDRWQGEDISCPVQVVSEPELLSHIQSTYTKDVTASEQIIMNSLISKYLLILDDVGKERRGNPDFVQRILFALVDGRYKLLRPIVLTTNLSPEALRDWMGPASFDRLWEMSGGSFFKITGESYRRVI